MYVSSAGPQGDSDLLSCAEEVDVEREIELLDAKALAGPGQHVDDSEGVEDVEGSGD